MFKKTEINEDGIRDVFPEEVLELKDQVELIDVRRPDEFTGQLGHISGARLSTLENEFQQEVLKLDPEKTYVFVCRSGRRSSTAAQIAIEHGIENVFNLSGGMIRWQAEGLEVAR